MDTWSRDKSVKEKTFHPSRSVSSSYMQSQIIPYSDARIKNTPQFNNSAPKTTRSKSTSSWHLGDPDLQRQRRVASYKVYTAEGKVKASLNRSLRWMKNKYIELRYGLL